MIRYSVLLVVGSVLLAACAGAKTTEKGPRIDVQFRCGRARLTEDSPADRMEECDLDTDKKAYVVTLSISANAGNKLTESSREQPEVFTPKPPTVTMDADGQSIPVPAFKTRDFFQGTAYETDEFTIPEASKGKTLTMHAETTDERGLQSNDVTLKVRLK